MSKVRLGFLGEEGDAFPPHFSMTDMKKTRTVEAVGDEEMGSTVVPIDMEQVSALLVHHMKQFETAGGMLQIDGFSVPAKAAARLYIDAIDAVLKNHGVNANLSVIRTELCPTCFGSQAPAQEFMKNETMTPGGVSHAQD